MNEKNIDTLRRAGLAIESGRLRRARSLTPDTWQALPGGGFEGVVLGGGQRQTPYHPAIRFDAEGHLTVACTCADWRTRGMHQSMPCKHILALAFHVGDIPTVSEETENEAAPADFEPEMLPEPPFAVKLRQAIADAIAALADRVDALMQAGEIPFLLGPTGSGKTSAVRLVAQRHGWAFEEVAGSPSFADSDLVGLRTDHIEVPGVFARAFRRAREQGETVLLFLDELTRFNARALDVLMRPLQVTSAETARAMGLAWSDIRLVEAPFGARTGRPPTGCASSSPPIPGALSSTLPWCAACIPCPRASARPCSSSSRSRCGARFGPVGLRWRAGSFPCPSNISSFSPPASPDDARIFTPYLHRLRALDPASAEGFQAILAGLGLSTGGAA